MEKLLPNYTIEEYFKKPESVEIDIYLEYLKPVNRFAGNVFKTSELTFNEFHTIISIFQKPNALDVKDLFIYLYRIKGSFKKSPDKIFYSQSIYDFYRAKNFVMDFVKQKLEMEKKMLYSEPDEKMQAINAYERLAPFNVMLTKVKIGEQFGFSPEKVGKWKYTRVLNIMAVNNIRSNIKSDYDRLS